MCQPPPDQAVGAVLGRASVAAPLETIHRIPSSRPQRPYELRLGGGRRLTLVTAPPSRLRLLRCEQRSTSTEAAVIRWLAEMLLPGPPGHGSRPEGRRDTTAWLPETSASDVDLASATPRLVAQSLASDELGCPYNIFDAPPGTTLRSLEPSLTPPERSVVDYGAGSLVRQLSSLTPTPPRFGPALVVLSSPSSSPSSSRRLAPRPTPTSPNREGLTASWSTAFHSLLEGALRDGEDMAIVLPYSAVRTNFRRLGYLLGMVTNPRLVVLDAAADDNLLVIRQPGVPAVLKNRRADSECLPPAEARRSTTPEPGGGRDKEETEDDSKVKKEDDGGNDDDGNNDDEKASASIAVTGIRDWSQAVFGDPLFAAAFCDEPSPEFHRGFDGPLPTGDPHRGVAADDLIEDREMAHVRILLYRCYHLVVAIVREYYRPTSQGSGQEMAARKRLGETLAKLGAIEDVPKRRHRRPSGEMSPAKKLRADTPDEDAGRGQNREEPADDKTGAKEKGEG